MTTLNLPLYESLAIPEAHLRKKIIEAFESLENDPTLLTRQLCKEVLEGGIKDIMSNDFYMILYFFATVQNFEMRQSIESSGRQLEAINEYVTNVTVPGQFGQVIAGLSLDDRSILNVTVILPNKSAAMLQIIKDDVGINVTYNEIASE